MCNFPVKLLLLACVLVLPALAARGADALTVESTAQPAEYAILYRGQPLMVYSFAPQKFKPYVKTLCTVRGDNVLRDAPFDHLHHHALMYGIRVNGVNFWEEITGSGVQRTVESPAPVLARNAAGQPQATLTHLIYWVAPADAFLPVTNTPPLLIEQRSLTLTVDEASREVAVQWRSRFAVGSKTNTVVLTGSNYHGLGMRFLKELDPFAIHFSPAGKTDLGGTRQDVTQLPWEAVAFDAPGKPATIALFGYPGNARGDARFFAMRDPFAYLSATQNLDQEPLVYHQGDKFKLDYLVVLYPEVKSTEALAKRGAQWQSLR